MSTDELPAASKHAFKAEIKPQPTSQKSWLDGGQLLDWSLLLAFAGSLRWYLRLIPALMFLGVCFAAAFYMLVPPNFTATALVGPPDPSPASSSSFSDSGSMASRLLGASRGGSSDVPYEDFFQLLPSTQLAQVLIDQDHIFDRISPTGKRTNAPSRAPGLLTQAIWAVKTAFHRPVQTRSDVDDLLRYFGKRLSVKPSTRASLRNPLTSTNPYMEVSFTYEDRAESEKLLTLILAETDRLIRERRRRDVVSRIGYLRDALSAKALTLDERAALTMVLSEQERTLSMMQADQRYASALIVAPYASAKPVSPPPIMATLKFVVIASLLIWVAIAFLAQHLSGLKRVLVKFKLAHDH